MMETSSNMGTLSVGMDDIVRELGILVTGTVPGIQGIIEELSNRVTALAEPLGTDEGKIQAIVRRVDGEFGAYGKQINALSS